MSVVTLASDLQACRRRTRGMLMGSGTVHALLLFWIALQNSVRAEEEILTEVTWMEPLPTLTAPPVAAAPEIAEPEPAPAPAAVQPTPEPERFERPEPVAEVTPTPQVSSRTSDALESRVASLLTEKTLSTPGLATSVAEPTTSRPSLASAASSPTPRAGRVALTRDENARPAPVSMTRGTTRPGRSTSLAMAGIDAPAASSTPTMSGTIDSTIVREMAGAKIIGAVANRPLRSHTKPVYPEWAKREGIEGTVTIRFLVQPNGHVRENILVERTSGFEDFDANATKALLAWVFEPLSGSAMGDQWGVITFNYRLSGR